MDHRRSLARRLRTLAGLLLLAFPAPAARAAALAAAPAAEMADFQPDADTEWHTDERGREYFLEQIPLLEGYYEWVKPDRSIIRVSFGQSYVVDSIDEDREMATIRIYKIVESKHEPPKGPTPEDLERIAAEYRIDLPSADRVAFSPVAGLPTQGQWRNGFDVADMNGDRRLDIVHGPPRKGPFEVMIFLGDGKGSFARWPAVRFPSDAHLDYGDVAAADFNRDGKMDLAVASHLRGLQVFVGDGNGRFERWSEGIEFHPTGEVGGLPLFSSRSIRVVDWNGDRRPDILAQAEGPALVLSREGRRQALARGLRGLRVYLNRGDGTWTKLIDPGSKGYGDDLALGDIDGNGTIDVLASSNVTGYRALLNLRQADGSWVATELPGVRQYAVVTAVLAEDLDADRSLDLVLAFTANEGNVTRSGIDVFWGRPDGERERRLLWAVDGNTAITALAAGDLDRDGRKDLVGFDVEGRSLVLLGDGARGFARQPSEPVWSGDEGCRAYRARLVDLDADRNLELVVNFAGETDAAFRQMIGLPPACQSNGSLRIWEVGPRGARAPAGTEP
jgi:hypothetical protein